MTKNELTAIIAERTGISRAEVRLFLDKFNETLFQGLNDDQQVKIRGLGTFKMVSVKARKSVNVNGGETIEIPAHNKVTFTAEKMFADMVNEPLAHLAVVDLSDDQADDVDPAEEVNDAFVAPARMKKLSEEAEELKGLLADINGVPAEAETPEEPVVEEEPVERPVKEESASEQPIAEPKLDDDDGDDDEEKTDMTHGGKMGRVFLWCMVLLLIVVGAIYWVNFRKPADVTEETTEELVPEPDNVAEVKDTVSQSVSDTLGKEDIQVSELSGSRLTIEQMRKIKIDFSDLKGTETVRDGSRLTMISLRAYGSKDFWIYLFLANRDKLNNPGQIVTGMVIKIPKLDSRLIDTSNPDCLQYAKELETQYVK